MYRRLTRLSRAEQIDAHASMHADRALLRLYKVWNAVADQERRVNKLAAKTPGGEKR